MCSWHSNLRDPLRFVCLASQGVWTKLQWLRLLSPVFLETAMIKKGVKELIVYERGTRCWVMIWALEQTRRFTDWNTIAKPHWKSSTFSAFEGRFFSLLRPLFHDKGGEGGLVADVLHWLMHDSCARTALIGAGMPKWVKEEKMQVIGKTFQSQEA